MRASQAETIYSDIPRASATEPNTDEQRREGSQGAGQPVNRAACQPVTSQPHGPASQLGSLSSSRGPASQLGSLSTSHRSTSHRSTSHRSVTSHPVTGQPVSGQPVASHPVTGQPVNRAACQPVTGHRSPVNRSPVSSPPVSRPPVSKLRLYRSPAGHRSPVNRSPVTGHRSTGRRSGSRRSTGHGSTGHRSPVTGQPVAGQVAAGQPVTGQPVTGHRATGHRSTGQRSSSHRSSGQQASSHRTSGHGSTGHSSNTRAHSTAAPNQQGRTAEQRITPGHTSGSEMTVQVADHTASVSHAHSMSLSADQSIGSSGDESPTGLEILMSPTESQVESTPREEPPEKRRRLFPDSLATVGSIFARTDPHETPAFTENAENPHDGRPEKTSGPANESIAEALALIRHLMADKIPEGEPTVLTETGTASLLAADLDDTLAENAEGFITLPLSQAVRTAVQNKLKRHTSSTFAQSLSSRRGAYQPSKTAEDPNPMLLQQLPTEEPGFGDLTFKKTNTGSILSSTTFNSVEKKELWLAAKTRLAISSTQDWTTAAIHRAVAHISALVPEEDQDLRQQLDGVRHLLCFLGKSVEDGFKADAAIAAHVTTAVRRSALQLLPDLSTAQKASLAEAPIEGNSLFGGRLQDTSLSESSEKRRSESRMIKALSSRPRASYQSTFAFPSGRSSTSRPSSTTAYTRGSSRSQTSFTRGGQNQRGQRTSSFPSPARGRGRGRRSTSSTNRGRPQRRV